MSLKDEQFRSLQMTRDFLYIMLDSQRRPKKVSEIREMALRCLRHYPVLKDDGEPVFSKH